MPIEPSAFAAWARSGQASSASARATPTRGAARRSPLASSSRSCSSSEPTAHGCPSPLDHALGREPPLRQRAHQGRDRLRVLGQRQPGDGHEPHVGVVVVEHRLQPRHALGQAQVGEDQHGAAAGGAGAGVQLLTDGR